MTDNTPGQVPEALRLADELCEAIAEYPEPTALEAQAAAELRRLHAYCQELESQVIRDCMTHVQNPAEIEHVAGDVSKNGAELNMSTRQTPPPKEVGQGAYETGWKDGYKHGARSTQQPAPSGAAEPDLSTPGEWFVRYNADKTDCFVAAPDCKGYAYGAEILGDDEYTTTNAEYDRGDLDAGLKRKIADCELIVASVKAYRASHGQAPATQQAGEMPESIEQLAVARYKVVPAHESMLHRWAVVAGDGAQQLYLGREVECENMARKFAGAFLDGAFVAMQNAAPQPSPTAQPAPATQPATQQEAQEPAAVVVPCHTPSGKRVALYSAKQDLPIGTKLYTAPQPSPTAQAAECVPAPVAAFEVADAMADSQYLAGVSAGWNAANAGDPNAALQKLHASRAGYLKPLSTARATADSVTAECGNCFEGKSDFDHVCKKCRGSGKAADSVLEDAARLTTEQEYAIRQGHEIAASEAYFGARSKLDTNRNHNIFTAGFERGWDAARKQGGAT